MDFISCPLRNFKCANYTKRIEIKNDNEIIFNILYRENELSNIESSYGYRTIFGQEQINYLKNNFICYEKSKKSVTNEISRKIITNNFYAKCQTFVNALWFIKDNAVTPYGTCISSNEPIQPQMLRRNVYYSNSKGEYKEVEFSKEELNKAVYWYNVLDKFTLKKQRDSIDMSKILTNMSNYISFDVPSFQRAFYYLDATRKMDFLPAKIASYISILEVLFAVNGENSHRVSERAAFLIAKDSDDRLKIFKDMKEIYKLRSYYVHGKQIKEKEHKTMPEYCAIIDDIVRRVMSKMYAEYTELNYFSKKDEIYTKNFEDVNIWFDEFVMRKE